MSKSDIANKFNNVRMMIDNPDHMITIMKLLYCVLLIGLVVLSSLATWVIVTGVGSLVTWIVIFIGFAFVGKLLWHERHVFEYQVDLFNVVFYLVMVLKDREDRDEILARFPDYYKYTLYDILREVRRLPEEDTKDAEANEE